MVKNFKKFNNIFYFGVNRGNDICLIIFKGYQEKGKSRIRKRICK